MRIDKDEVLVDIGYKSEGVIPQNELSIRRSIDPAEEVSLGRRGRCPGAHQGGPGRPPDPVPSVKGTELAVPVNLIRLSCGIEDVEDLIADLEQAFARPDPPPESGS